MNLSKLRRILTCGYGKNPDSSPKDAPHTNTWREEDDDSMDNLSEVAAPFPIERLEEGDRAHRESLESDISKEPSQPHLSNN